MQVEWIYQLYDIEGKENVNMHNILHILEAANIHQHNQLSDIFVKMDTNKDGFLSYEEFSNGCLNDLTFLKIIGGMKKHERRSSLISLNSVRSFVT